MMEPERVAYRLKERSRTVYQRLLDSLMAGDPVARAALEERYRPIHEYQKEGPDVGQRESAESEAGRVN